ATFQLRRQIGTWLLGHSYKYLSFCELKMNSASRGGRAAKNAIDGCNHTSNNLHVKVLSHADYDFLVNDSLLHSLLQYKNDIQKTS
ncbi:MAG TPA: hypothetical protein PK414_10865, partial [Anaerolineales bacterium]|nr:hypothetical protein [Anaerolineales bacterium]HNC08425.1 hypothetical protein [Anaerolineales bacterium]